MTLRQIKNAHLGMEITCLSVCLKLNLFATSSGGAIFLWDYESFRMTGACSNDFQDVHALQFLYPYQAIASLDNSSIVLWHWENFSAFRFIQPFYKIEMVSPKGKQFLCNQMLHFAFRQTDLLEVEGNGGAFQQQIEE
mmetsp:Transcript_6882/g.5116  ORF Transcript_6882/g.5116 Transcript_6882/m.5116 type:complete len:138 (-) Transcript_6882:1691-2104(-)